MSIKQSKSFFNFLLDKHTTKKQIHFVLTNLAHIHLESVTELIYNLLENKFIKISPSLKSVIKKHKNILVKFISSIKKSLYLQRKILKKYYKIFYYIIRLSKNTLLLAIH